MDDLSLNEKLQLSRDDMRQMGYQVIDTLVDYFDRQSTVRATNLMDVDAVRAIASEALPIEGLPWPEVLEQFDRQVISSLSHVDHPRNFAFIPLASNFVGAMADTLAAGYNIFNAVYKQGESASEIERVTVDWLRQIFGMPKETGGIFVSGGSVANLSALAVARQVQLAGDMHDAVATVRIRCISWFHVRDLGRNIATILTFACCQILSAASPLTEANGPFVSLPRRAPPIRAPWIH